MNLNSLKPADGSVKKSKRVGRGQGSGRGGTSTRGHKGARSRSGYSSKAGFEGGQMPIQRRVPKYGFKNINRIEYIAINLDVLQRISEEYNVNSFDADVLKEYGIISKGKKYKVLGNGDLTAKVTVKAHAFSKTAVSAIENAGGSIETL
ncbi:MAG: 50S ribosomal protein L15 [Flavobacterium sp.]|nr:MAG: 50S ribosomal protein L15 [Flavobacterium sp.]